MQHIIDQLSTLVDITLNGGADSDQHLLTLFSLVCQIKAKNILELGVRQGTTTLPLLLGAALTGAQVTSVDLHAPHSGVFTELAKRNLSQYWNFVQSDAIEYLSTAGGSKKWDLVFIDDWHSCEHVLQELTLLAPTVSKSSLIVLHDLMHSFRHPDYNRDAFHKSHEFADGGPCVAVEKFLAQQKLVFNVRWEFATIPVNHGLTILRKVT